MASASSDDEEGEPREPPVWLRLPGYESDGSDDSEDAQAAAAEEEAFRSTAQERLQAIVSVLGERWVPTSSVSFSPVKPGACEAVPPLPPGCRPAARFRIEHADAQVVRDTLVGNGLRQTHEKDWLIQWSGPSMKESVYHELEAHQRVNHFPGSTELTRKDRMWCHFQEMAKTYGSDEFDFLPETYVLPAQLDEFLECYDAVGGLWIVKPHASSRGRGIFLLKSLKELPIDEVLVVSRYVENPLLIQGLKFDLRLYVLVTSYEPLRAYVYREGLTRFASRPYSTKPRHLEDAYRHLTNYSINKKSSMFVENAHVDQDNVGHKWSLSALNKHLNCDGVDVRLMWRRILDVIAKSLLSVEQTIASRSRRATAHRESCFELYGFDVLVDEDLKPWLLEVNLSPSMHADSPLDWQIKSSLLSDALNLVGVCRHSLSVARLRTDVAARRNEREKAARQPSRRASAAKQLRAAARSACDPETTPQALDLDAIGEGLLRTLARSCEETGRCHNFIRLYPTRATVRRYDGISRAAGRAAAAGAAGHGPDRRRGGGEDVEAGVTASMVLAALLFGPAPVRSSQLPEEPREPERARKPRSRSRSGSQASTRASTRPSSRPSSTPSSRPPSAPHPLSAPALARIGVTEAPRACSNLAPSTLQALPEAQDFGGPNVVAAEYFARLGKTCAAGAEFTGEVLRRLRRNEDLFLRLALLERRFIAGMTEDAPNDALGVEAPAAAQPKLAVAPFAIEALLQRLAARASSMAARLAAALGREVDMSVASVHAEAHGGAIADDDDGESARALVPPTLAGLNNVELERMLTAQGMAPELRALLAADPDDTEAPRATERRPASQQQRPRPAAAVAKGACTEWPLVELERCLEAALLAAAASPAPRPRVSSKALRLEGGCRQQRPRSGLQRVERRCLSVGSLCRRQPSWCQEAPCSSDGAGVAAVSPAAEILPESPLPSCPTSTTSAGAARGTLALGRRLSTTCPAFWKLDIEL